MLLSFIRAINFNEWQLRVILALAVKLAAIISKRVLQQNTTYLKLTLKYHALIFPSITVDITSTQPSHFL